MRFQIHSKQINITLQRNQLKELGGSPINMQQLANQASSRGHNSAITFSFLHNKKIRARYVAAWLIRLDYVRRAHPWIFREYSEYSCLAITKLFIAGCLPAIFFGNFSWSFSYDSLFYINLCGDLWENIFFRAFFSFVGQIFNDQPSEILRELWICNDIGEGSITSLNFC